MRAGKAYFATPLGRVRVRDNPRASLISELDAGGWLTHVRALCRDKSSPAAFTAVGRDLDEALFYLAADGSSDAVQDVLIALGALMLNLGRRPKLREDLPPPPRLSTEWIAVADDASHEFALAEALASLDSSAGDFRLPFRRHLAPLDWEKEKSREMWGKSTEAQVLAVWTGRDLVRDMASILERRLIEAARRNFTWEEKAELPLRGWRSAPLASVAAFLGGRADDDRIAALAAGFAWARTRMGTQATGEREHTLTFAYAALKPLLVPDGVGPVGEKRLLDPLPLVRLIRARRVDDAVGRAQAMARGTGLPAPFTHMAPVFTLDSERLAAALLFPLSPMANARLIVRAYPDLSEDKENEIYAT
jgi:CRISPR-associated protein Csx17